MLVILDSSMLMLPLEKKINISLELERILSISFEVVIPKIVILELEKIIRESLPSICKKAKLALEIAQQYKILESKTEGHTDKEIERLALEHSAIVATNDTKLRSRLRKHGIAVIGLYGKNKLSVFGHI